MNAIAYLMKTTFKNKLLNLKKKPGLLILYLIIFASILLMMISTAGRQYTKSLEEYKDIRLLYGIIAVVGLIYIYTFIATGLEKGSTLFTMSDVGLLFPSPISSKRILIYGLLKQLSTTMLTSIFILYQVGNLKNSFLISTGSIVGLFFIYAIMIFFCQLLAIMIYVFSNGNGKRKKLIQWLLYIMFAIIILAFYVNYQDSNSLKGACYQLVDSKMFGLVPVAGWAIIAMKGLIEGKIIFFILGIGLFVLCSTLIVLCITSGTADYYEDVLLSTEHNFEKIQAAKEGKRVVDSKRIKIKENSTGICGGYGASAIFFRHLHEIKRESKFLFLSKFTIIGAIVGGVAAYKVRSAMFPYIAFGVLVYLLIFTTMGSKLTYELTKPYIYLIPDHPVRKLFYAILSNIVKSLVDGVVIFLAIGVCLGQQYLLCLFLALAYTCTAAVFTVITVFYQRFFGGQPNKLVAIVVLLFLVGVVLVPAVVCSSIVTAILPNQLAFLGTLPYIGICSLMAFLGILMSKDVFNP